MRGAKAERGPKLRAQDRALTHVDLADKRLGWPTKRPDFGMRVDKACNLISRITNWIFPVKTELATEKPLWQP